MAFNIGAALLDALVLSTVHREPTYGYRITQDVRQVMLVSESTLYPVLRRLQKDGFFGHLRPGICGPQPALLQGDARRCGKTGGIPVLSFM